MAKLNSGTRIYGNLTIDTFVTANAATVSYLTAANVVGTTFMFANGVNILTTVSGGGSSGAGNVNQTLYAGNVTSTSTTAAKLVDSVSTTGNTLVRWTTTSTDVTNSRFRVSTLDVLSDGTNVYYTEYGTIKSNNSYNVANFTSNIYAGTIALWATTPDSTNTTVVYQRVILGSTTPQGYLNTGQTGATGATGPAGSISNTSGNIVTTSANAATGASNSTGALQVGGGAGIAGALYVGGTANFNNGVVTTGNETVSGNVTAGNVSAGGFYFANGSPFVSSSYGNTSVAQYLPTYTGNLTAGNIVANTAGTTTTVANLVTTNGIYWANGSPYSSGSSGSGSGTAIGNNSIITNNQSITANATILQGSNGFSVGPVTTANGVTVTVTNGQRWVII